MVPPVFIPSWLYAMLLSLHLLVFLVQETLARRMPLATYAITVMIKEF